MMKKEYKYPIMVISVVEPDMMVCRPKSDEPEPGAPMRKSAAPSVPINILYI